MMTNGWKDGWRDDKTLKFLVFVLFLFKQNVKGHLKNITFCPMNVSKFWGIGVGGKKNKTLRTSYLNQ